MSMRMKTKTGDTHSKLPRREDTLFKLPHLLWTWRDNKELEREQNPSFITSLKVGFQQLIIEELQKYHFFIAFSGRFLKEHEAAGKSTSAPVKATRRQSPGRISSACGTRRSVRVVTQPNLLPPERPRYWYSLEKQIRLSVAGSVKNVSN